MVRLRVFKIFIFIVFISGCSEEIEKISDTPSVKNPFVSENSIEDSLISEIYRVRNLILAKSDKPQEELLKNFRLLGAQLIPFLALKDVDADSLKFHAPLEVVNQKVKDYNHFCDENTFKNWDSLFIFSKEQEYISRRDEYMSIIMMNELNLYKSYGYE